MLQPGFYEDQERRTRLLVDPILAHAERLGSAAAHFHPGQHLLAGLQRPNPHPPGNEIDPDSMAHFTRLHGALLERGVYLEPSGYEVGFVSAAHSEAVIAEAVSAFTDAWTRSSADRHQKVGPQDSQAASTRRRASSPT